MAYIKRLAMPNTWPLARKGSTYVAKPLPGRQLGRGMPLSLIVKHLGFAKTTKEVKFILNAGRIKVNNKVMKEKSFPIGLFDVVSFPSIKKNFRMLFKNKKLFLHVIDDKEAMVKPAKVIGKTYLKGKKLQINLDDGRNLLSGDYKVGDTLVIDLEKNSVSSHLKFEKGSLAYILGGKYIGSVAKVIELEKEKAKAICEIGPKKTDIPKRYIFIIGKEKPVISLPNE